MATKKRNKSTRAGTGRAKVAAGAARKTGAAKKSAGRRPKATTLKAPKSVAKKTKAAAAGRASARAVPKRIVVTRPVAKPTSDSRELIGLKSKFQRERSGLEKRLTEAAREIGMLRHHELRATHLERQLAERDATIARLQMQLADLERRPAEPVYVQEVQQTLALGGPANAADAGDADLDEFDESVGIADEAELIGDDE
jgi:hypothetical protein